MPPSANYFTIVLVEDEIVLREEMAFQLRHHGFKVEGFENAQQLYRYLAVQPNSIVVLDIGLPNEDGIDICKYLRTYNSLLGIVFVTARGMHADRITGLRAGADAYLAKPVDMTELLLILERLSIRMNAKSDMHDSGKMATQAGWQLDTNQLTLKAPNNTRIRLSYNESQLLLTLLSKQGVVCTHAELALSIGINPNDLDKHRIEVILSRLGKKIERNSTCSLPIESRRGVGYLLVGPV